MDGEAVFSEIEQKPEFGWLMEAKRFLLAGENLRKCDAYGRTRLLVTPTLHVIAHGIELFLKGALIRHGETQDKAESYKHDILALWNHDRNATTRSDILIAAGEVWDAASQDPKWNDDFTRFERLFLERDLQLLSRLHTPETRHALRYPLERTPDMEGPRPHLIGPTFYQVADRYLREMTWKDKNDLSLR